MTLKSPLSVRVERPGKSLGDIMNEYRSWLDGHKIQPTEFRSDSSVPGGAAFEISFNREHGARTFEQALVRMRSDQP
jgi:hypothetical protein